MMNKYQFSDVHIGDTVTFIYEINKEKMRLFEIISGDHNPLHTNLEYAREMGFSENVVYGQLTSAALSTLAGMYMPGMRSIIHSIETNFLNPVFLSKCPLKVVGKVKEMDERFKTILLKFEIFNIDNVKVCRGKMRIGFLGKGEN